jgi:hypothetical protein
MWLRLQIVFLSTLQLWAKLKGIRNRLSVVVLQREPGALLPDGQADLERLGRCLRLVISHRQFLKHASTHFSILGLRLHLVVA